MRAEVLRGNKLQYRVRAWHGICSQAGELSQHQRSGTCNSSNCKNNSRRRFHTEAIPRSRERLLFPIAERRCDLRIASKTSCGALLATNANSHSICQSQRSCPTPLIADRDVHGLAAAPRSIGCSSAKSDLGSLALGDCGRPRESGYHMWAARRHRPSQIERRGIRALQFLTTI